MKITSIEIINLAEAITVHQGKIGWLWVRIHSDEGIVGLGETYPFPDACRAVIRDSLAPVLLGKNPLQIDYLWAEMFASVNFAGWAGAEMRAISAIDIALWDIAGKAAGVPIYQLLGGHSRDSIRIYNTFFNYLLEVNRANRRATLGKRSIISLSNPDWHRRLNYCQSGVRTQGITRSTFRLGSALGLPFLSI